jgi:hypothetical protein
MLLMLKLRLGTRGRAPGENECGRRAPDIVVHGSTFPLEWLRLTVNPRNPPQGPDTFGPFGWTRLIQ